MRVADAPSYSIRQLRNETVRVIENARLHGGVVITSHGKPVAKLMAIDELPWTDFVDQLVEDLTPVDTGFLDELAADDAASQDDLA